MTAHPVRGSQAGTPKSLEALHPLMGGAAEGQPGEVLLFPSASLGLVCNEPGEATRNSSYCLQSEPLMRTSGASELRCKRVLPDQRCSSGSGKPGINYILLPCSLTCPRSEQGHRLPASPSAGSQNPGRCWHLQFGGWGGRRQSQGSLLAPGPGSALPCWC